VKIRYLIPLFIFLVIAGILWRSLSMHPNQIPSPFINKHAPAFQLPSLLGAPAIVTEKELRGHISLVNVWATWCYACALEHDFLLELSKNKDFVLYGLNYKDDPLAAKKWLKEHGNPYARVAVDESGDAAINWGVYGSPETFVIDKNGIIRYKQIGPITEEVWEQELKPVIEKIRNEA
jgi:cytochrome c biogenesis protein CcmG/thiol:disulfide interchange protein DsbE